jgi:prevent-host-death family protein
MPSTSRKPAARKRRKPARKAHPADTAMVVNVHEAKTQLSRLLGRVERGERITIARAGKAVAVMAPPTPAEHPTLSLDDPLLNLDKFGFDGPGGVLTARGIDRIVYGA